MDKKTTIEKMVREAYEKGLFNGTWLYAEHGEIITKGALGWRDAEDRLPMREDSFFDLRGATFCATPPLHRDFLQPEEAGRIRLLMRMDYPTMHLFRLSRNERNRILDVLLTYYRLHLPGFPTLRSLSVLQELYQ